MRDFSHVKRIVVKVGTNLLSTENGIDEKRIDSITEQISNLKNKGYQVILVSSGAVGMGAKELGHKTKVVHIPLKQACAAIGQPILMSSYRESFKKHNIICAQVLITRHDLDNRFTYNNLRSSVSTLLSLGIVPVFNENDTVSVSGLETAFGDNDRMSALIASKIDAELLILLTDIDGLYTGNPKKDKDAVLLTEVDEITNEIMSYAKGKGSEFSTGGMETKLLAAQIASVADCQTVIASGYEENILERIVNNEELGTLINAKQKLKQRDRWILNSSPVGHIIVDEGAKKALLSNKSLLPSGVIKVIGVFNEGDVVTIETPDNKGFLKAVTYYNSNEITLVVGKKTSEVKKILGDSHKDCIFRPEDSVVIEDAE